MRCQKQKREERPVYSRPAVRVDRNCCRTSDPTTCHPFSYFTCDDHNTNASNHHTIKERVIYERSPDCPLSYEYESSTACCSVLVYLHLAAISDRSYICALQAQSRCQNIPVSHKYTRDIILTKFIYPLHPAICCWGKWLLTPNQWNVGRLFGVYRRQRYLPRNRCSARNIRRDRPISTT